MKKIAIDLVPIRVGEGGTGSGIWTYARELIQHMDVSDRHGLEIVCLVNDGQLPFLSDLQNIRLIRFPGFGKNSVLRVLWIHLFLPLVCLFRRFDVLHKLATETPLFCPARRVTTVHDFYYEFLIENHSPKTIRLYERLENFYFSLTTRTCSNKSRAIIAVSESTRQEAIRRYPKSEDCIYVIHHGASPKAPSPRPKTSSFTILCVAKFMEHKGQHVLIDAFEALLEQHPERVGLVRLELRGFHNDADYCRMITERIASSRFSEYMQMVGFDPTGGLEAIYHDADLVVLLSSYEGFGLPVLEAQGMGIPVLCSDLPVLREVGGRGAVYVGRDTIQAVAEQLNRFVVDQDFCQKMKALGAENTKRFRWERAAMETIRCYREVLH